MQLINKGIKVREASALMDIPISSLYYRDVRGDRDQEIARLIEDITYKHTFYGYRRILLGIEGQGDLYES